MTCHRFHLLSSQWFHPLHECELCPCGVLAVKQKARPPCDVFMPWLIREHKEFAYDGVPDMTNLDTSDFIRSCYGMYKSQYTFEDHHRRHIAAYYVGVADMAAVPDYIRLPLGLQEFILGGIGLARFTIENERASRPNFVWAI